VIGAARARGTGRRASSVGAVTTQEHSCRRRAQGHGSAHHSRVPVRQRARSKNACCAAEGGAVRSTCSLSSCSRTSVSRERRSSGSTRETAWSACRSRNASRLAAWTEERFRPPMAARCPERVLTSRRGHFGPAIVDVGASYRLVVASAAARSSTWPARPRTASRLLRCAGQRRLPAEHDRVQAHPVRPCRVSTAVPLGRDCRSAQESVRGGGATAADAPSSSVSA
jgi:hypothetical protein